MADETQFAVRLSRAAQVDFREILTWSEEKFGHDAAERYRGLIVQALRDLRSGIAGNGVRWRTEIAPDAETYHLGHSRDRVEGNKVANPRHLFLLRRSQKGLEVVRILHERRELLRHWR